MGPIMKITPITQEQRDAFFARMREDQNKGRVLLVPQEWFYQEMGGPEYSETDVDGREVAEHAASTTLQAIA